MKRIIKLGRKSAQVLRKRASELKMVSDSSINYKKELIKTAYFKELLINKAHHDVFKKLV